MTLKFVLLSVSLLPSLWLSSTAETGPASQMEKRFSINMMDPFTRRSALDKNFVRFGRSGSSGAGRESRGRPDSFVRFGRSDGEREENDDDEGLSRDARGRTDFIRFGRGRQDNFIRFGRGDKSNNNGFIRFGRARHDNFVRFGRGRPDNFIRFGKSLGGADYEDDLDEQSPADSTRSDDEELERISRGGSTLNKNFVRFGKRDPENNEEVVNAYNNGMNFETQPSKETLSRFVRIPSNSRGSMKSDSFIRFGRSPAAAEDPAIKDLSKKIANYLKETDNLYEMRHENGKSPSIFRENSAAGDPFLSELTSSNENNENEREVPKHSSSTNRDSSDIYLPYDGSSTHELVRKKRMTSKSALKSRESSQHEESSTGDRANLQSSFYSPLAAGLPGFILGPELSVLPVHQPAQKCGGKSEDSNFIRLG